MVYVNFCKIQYLIEVLEKRFHNSILSIPHGNPVNTRIC